MDVPATACPALRFRVDEPQPKTDTPVCHETVPTML
jgi:hypothetical protein